MKKVSSFAKKTFRALNCQSVYKVYPEIIEECENRIKNGEPVYYVGVKNTHVFPSEYLDTLQKEGYLIHTKDKMSHNGRAIDLSLHNPITGRYMTGSSSGTAINVFLGINDLGIGTDGGGSVLAPAAALNLFGFISPLICQKEMERFQKKSTDSIIFTPSIGYMSKQLDPLRNLVNVHLHWKTVKKLNTVIAIPKNNQQTAQYNQVKKVLNCDTTLMMNYDTSSRHQLIKDLQQFDFNNQLLITFEGPVDVLDYGDSVMGNYSNSTKQKQQNGHKYYLTVVNMLGLSALTIPSNDLAVSTLIICQSEPDAILAMFNLANKIPFVRSALEENYFSIENM